MTRLIQDALSLLYKAARIRSHMPGTICQMTKGLT